MSTKLGRYVCTRTGYFVVMLLCVGIVIALSGIFASDPPNPMVGEWKHDHADTWIIVVSVDNSNNEANMRIRVDGSDHKPMRGPWDGVWKEEIMMMYTKVLQPDRRIR